MAEKQFNKWKEYRKWYEKQQRKGFLLSKQALTWYDSYENYLRQYDYAKELKAEKPEEYRDKSFYDIIKSRSYNSTPRQTEYFYNRVVGILDDLTERAESGDAGAKETLEDVFAKFGDVRTVDKQTVIYQQLKGGDIHFEYRGYHDHGWYGDIMNMLVYFERNGIIDQIYV